MTLNRDVLARDPSSFALADGGVAKVSFPPSPDEIPVLREQLSMFVCEGAYADALRRILEGYLAVAGGKTDTPAAWVSGFYGSGKSLLAAMLGALWTDFRFSDGASAEGLIHDIPDDLRAALKELRTKAKRFGADLVVGGTTLGRGAGDPVKAVFSVIMRAAGLPATSDLRPMLFALWLAEQGVLDAVRASLGDAFPTALEAFLLDERIAKATLAAKPSLAPDPDTLMDRLNNLFANEPEPTPDLLIEKARQALTLGGRDIPLTLIILDEVQQFLREDSDRSLTIQLIAEGLAAKFKGRVLLVCTGQSALGDIPYLEKLLGRFPMRHPLGSADINSVVRKTILRKNDTARPQVEAMLNARSGEIDKHLQGSILKRTEADRKEAVADWPLLSTRRKLWERVMQELDRSGLGATLRSQLRLTLDAVRQYGPHELGVAVPGDFLLETFGAEALSRQLIGREFFDKVETLRDEAGDGPLKARILLVVYMLAKIAGDSETHGVRATPEIIADLLIENLSDAAALRAKIPQLLATLRAEGHLIDVGDEWRLQSKESAEWQAAYNKAHAEEAGDVNGIARYRQQLLETMLDTALSNAGQVVQGASKTARKIERVYGDAKPSGSGLVLRFWNGWEHGAATLNDIKAADVAKDATLHMMVPAHRSKDLSEAIVTLRAVPVVMQRQGVPSTDGGKEAKAAMQARLDRAQLTANEILAEAVADAKVLIAGGREIGIGQSRADAVKDAAQQVLDRLYPDFATADHAGWDRVVTKAKARQPDAIKEVGHQGEPQDHTVCKALLRALGSGKRGSDLRTLFGAPPYGWPREAVDGGLRVLALAGQVKVADANHKPADLAALNDTQLGTCQFTAESRPPTMKEKLALRGLGAALGIKIAAGEELVHLRAIVDALEALAREAGGEPPSPPPPSVPGQAAYHAASGNDLLAELAARAAELGTLIPQWQAARKVRAERLRDWTLATALIRLGAKSHAAETDAIRANRSLLDETNPVAALVAAAAETLRAEAHAAFKVWQEAWAEGEARLKADAAWNKIDETKRHELRQEHRLLPVPEPDLSAPEKIVESLNGRGLGQWRDMAAAHPARIEEALCDAAVELEPKMQMVSIPRPVLKTGDDLTTWLDNLRAEIEPRLLAGPVLPTA
ncbi:MAG TPA: BREX system P-loop protein BrxC [Roseomonas sp.]|nr:BREX system P-loop protein BrxC [Roseomonas sp.]